ncbi:MAG TPA: alanine racemase [Candidatus Acidoferrales bacterium]|nr:alanine racemase [Candidatus Acidoferrales bacterium]
MKPTLCVRLDAIRHNVRVWRSRLGDRPLWAIVKCDAYRMGMVPVAKAALEAGAQRLCVVEIAEGSELRAAGIAAPIVHVAATPVEDFPTALAAKLIISIGDAGAAKELSSIAKRMGVRAMAHVAVETGTGWWGVPSSRAAEFAREVASLENIVWEGTWTHIAGRDSIEAQEERFHHAVAALRQAGLAVPAVHAASTGPTLWGLDSGIARIGVGLYGSSLGTDLGAAALKTAAEVRAPVYSVRTFSEATPLGYGGAHVAQAGETIATLRIGYGEGLPKTLSGSGSALLDGVSGRIVGAIGMNFTMVSLPKGAKINARGDALLLGDAPGVRLDEVAKAGQTIPHHVLTQVGAGMTRIYES